ncbi:multifunctional CCA addition/repair protein [Shewanella sp. C32]|uniref:Multifunctional CCA protein n=1 Tax=Shewanella electrica TaxID=515560 RepID=A0ABT2FFX5_9GAMM|nr:multifunctional CCA addition/repair protein [Shewanella electrica]MCH1925375.1 multifunctional CCA addition/repair protein [Shewanella electrica]MCS4555200.1 multifunctional CCA addition/repair protein [Shewanella electrica]
MQFYLVGGAVRDQLLGLAIKDRDHLVVGATVEQMLAKGYRQVGKDFPVFLHPKTQEEYALARTERKTGRGYGGFTVDASPEVTLEEDLLRRDLTINAIAQDEHGQLFDPYGGQQDLQQRVLRHVSPAFVEDPLRVLRVARFAARYANLGFTVAPETMALMRELAESGELEALSAERLWQELERALNTPSPWVFIEVLRDCGALAHVMPEIDALFGVPQPAQWHPEIDTGIHTLMSLKCATQLSDDAQVRFATLLHDLGKALTPEELLPKHHGHGQAGQAPIRELCQRLRVPNEYRDLALLASDLHQDIHNLPQLKPSTVLRKLDQIDAWRKPHRVTQLISVCQADAQGRTGLENQPYPQGPLLQQIFDQTSAVDIKPILAAGYKGAEIKEQVAKIRTTIIKLLLTEFNQNV